jgi:hypothetical protein
VRIRATHPRSRWLRCALAGSLAWAAAGAICAPVEVYREGRFCPRDRPAGSQKLTEPEAIARARSLLPEDFCGPTAYVSGCDYLAEYTFDSWRVYAHQYRDREGRHDWKGLTHTYVILDPVGNCFANIPGTELGATR